MHVIKNTDTAAPNHQERIQGLAKKIQPFFKSSKPVAILIIDDDDDDFEIIRSLIIGISQQKFQIDWCNNYDDGSSALRNSTHDLFFIDYHLGAKTGIELLKEALAHGCEEPMILLTGQGNRKIDLEAMHSGAVDYLVKSEITSEQLERCIRYSLERSATLKKSRASELKFRSIFDKSKDVIFISNSQLEFQTVNPIATEIFGVEMGELLQQNTIKIFVHQSDKDTVLNILNTEKKITDFGIELYTKDKAVRNFVLSASIESDEMRNPYIQGIIHDISLFKKVEEIKLQSEKLEARGETIRTLAHEIRNPLTNIILSTEYLKNETSTENQEFLSMIKRNSKKISDLINELLDTNQFYKLKLNITPLQLVIHQALEEVADRIELKKVKVTLALPLEDALALVDEEKMRVALLNIMINAIEAMKDEMGELVISIFPQGTFHMIEIKDNGHGISAENIGKLFEPYFTTKSTGLGLGLSATYSILQSHKAEIKVSSVHHEGTTFTIRIPSL